MLCTDWESNPGQQIGSLSFYHLTTSAYLPITGFEPVTYGTTVHRSTN